MKPLLLTLCALLLAAGAASALELKLRPQALVEGQVSLGDLVALSADSVALVRLPLGPAPELGQERTLAPAEVEAQLRRQRPDLPAIRWRGAKRVRLVGGGQLLKPADLQAALTDYLRSQQPRLPRAQYRLRHLRLPAETLLPSGAYQVQVVPSNAQILGSHRFTLIFRQHGKAVANLTVSGELEALAPVLTAAVDLRRGTVIGAKDLTRTVMDITDLHDPLLSPTEVVGKRMQRSVRAGRVVERSAVAFPPMVRRGEVVTISVKRGAMQLSARGKARESGRRGESIRVRNLGSGREILCRVTAPGQVEVEM